MHLRKCRDCGREASSEAELVNYVKDKTCRHGHKNWCLECRASYDKPKLKEYYKTNLLQRKNYNKNNLSKNRVHCSTWYKANKHLFSAYEAQRRAGKLQRTPKWLTKADFRYIKSLYVSCSLISKLTNVPHHVDHIVPLRGKTVSGLHCPSNLQIITAKKNLSKSNKF